MSLLLLLLLLLLVAVNLLFHCISLIFLFFCGAVLALASACRVSSGTQLLPLLLFMGNRRLPFFLRQRYLTWETPLSANGVS